VSQSLFGPWCNPSINGYCRRYGTLSRVWAFPKPRGLAVSRQQSPRPSPGTTKPIPTTRKPAQVRPDPFSPFPAHSPDFRRRERVPRARA
jgi:hypothetical protein